MSNERLQEAVSLFNSGDKTQAAKLLSDIVRQEPDNSLAWYGLALCLDEVSKKIYCVKRVLAIDPSNQKAHQLLTRLDGLEISSDNSESAHNKKRAIGNSPREAKKSGGNGVYAIIALFFIVIVGVISVSAFLFLKVGSLEIFESPENKYSREIEPVLIKIDKWYQGPIAQMSNIMDDTVKDEQGKEIDKETTNGWMLEACIIYYNAGLSDNCPNLMVQTFVPTAESIVHDGYDIQVSLGGITPPDEIIIAHQQIYNCVKYKMDSANALIKFLTEDTMLEENLGEDFCTLMPNALEKVTTFAQENR